MKFKCESCPSFIFTGIEWFCKKLKHPLENGYAMLAHSKECGYSPEVKNK